MEKADFFLTLLDPENKENRKYLSESSTGSAQLILGFIKPCLINEEFANAYKFNENNAITYKHNNLAEAMQAAILLKAYEYKKMQSELKILADNVYTESLNNLKTTINE